MSSFTTPLRVEFIDGRDWRVCEPFTYCIGSLAEPIGTVTIPAGFVTDFASVPRVLWNLLPPTGLYGKAGVLHDYLYRRLLLTRRECDNLLLEAMQALGVPGLTCAAVFLGVRLGGWVTYRHYRKNHKES